MFVFWVGGGETNIPASSISLFCSDEKHGHVFGSIEGLHILIITCVLLNKSWFFTFPFFNDPVCEIQLKNCCFEIKNEKVFCNDFVCGPAALTEFGRGFAPSSREVSILGRESHSASNLVGQVGLSKCQTLPSYKITLLLLPC